MQTYDLLLLEIRTKVLNLNNIIRTTAKEYIPQLYQSLCHENSNITTLDARERIEKDCLELWSKRTIIDALPDEAKNLKKQKAGRQKHKNQKQISAAIIAVPKKEQQKLILDVNGSSTNSNEIEDLIN